MITQTDLRANNAPGARTELFITSVDKAALLSPEEILVSFKTNDKEGLSGHEAKKRLETFGKNVFEQKTSVSPIRLFLSQFWSTVIALLVIAAGVSYASGELLQAAAILSAVLINAIVGFITEYQAQISLSALEKLTGPVARVRRDCRDLEISASEIVPGDLLIIDSGCRIPADVRFISSASLSVDESMLTGESISVFKDTNPQLDAISTGVGYQGSLVLSGRAKAIVIATGKGTKLGQLGEELSKIHSKATPLESDLEKLGQRLSLLTMCICAFVFAIGILHGEDISAMIQTSVALAIAAIPEGLPVVATMALASGTAKMVNLGVLIRKLSAVETLGCTQVICTDKTGTLTQNKMCVTDIVFIDGHISVSGKGYEPSGDFFEHDSKIAVDKHPELLRLMTIATLCNDAKLEKHNDKSEWHIHGDPTEGALLTAAHKSGVEQNEQAKLFPRVHEFPFDLNRKRMSTVHSLGKTDSMICLKGAPESVLSICKSYLTDSGPELFDEEKKKWVMQKNKELAEKGLRVLALASKSINSHLITDIAVAENELTFVGLVGMADQPKQGVREAIERLCCCNDRRWY